MTIIKFKNFSSYVQQQIDNLLHFHHQYIKAYVDDIVIFFKTLNEYLAYLRVIFELLNVKDVTLSIKKSFIDYSTITLLSQRINAFEFSTIIKKIDVIKRLAFLYILIDLKLYLRLIKYLRIYISYYAQKTDALQKRKMFLLCLSSSNKDRQKKIFNQRTVLENFINEKFNSYRLLQKVFNKINFFIHFNRDRVLYIDINTLKQRDFDVMIYHLKVDVDLKKFRVIDIEFILFLNWLLNIAEFKY